MGSKSGRKRRRRERKLKAGADSAGSKPQEPVREPVQEVEPAPEVESVQEAESVQEPVREPVPAEPVREVEPTKEAEATEGGDRDERPGPAWTPPPGPAPHGEKAEPALPITSAAAPSAPTPDEEAPTREAALADPGVAIAHGARETLEAIRRLETRVDRLSEWLGGFTAWYQYSQQSDSQVGEDVRAARRRRLVAAMVALFLVPIVLLVLAIRFDWF